VKDDFEKWLEEQLKDPEFKAEYERLETEYGLIEKELNSKQKEVKYE